MRLGKLCWGRQSAFWQKERRDEPALMGWGGVEERHTKNIILEKHIVLVFCPLSFCFILLFSIMFR